MASSVPTMQKKARSRRAATREDGASTREDGASMSSWLCDGTYIACQIPVLARNTLALRIRDSARV